MGSVAFEQPGQAVHSPGRARRCLLKGCERWFVPRHPQSRYCGSDCACAARRWRCVKASRRYRASPNGRLRRREQNRGYRRRRACQKTALSADAAGSREGKRPTSNAKECCERMCDRPGCYAVFAVKDEYSRKHFCSLGCRLALRRVMDREARYWHRRQRWQRETWRPGPQSDTS
jgi:hypothetical protein